MAFDRHMLDQLRHLVRPLASRVANVAARALVHLVDDSKKMQLIQIGVIEDETADDAEHFQPYGFYSVPLPGAEAAVIFPNGDRSHPIAVVVSDRSKRPTGGESGEVGVYGPTGARITMMANGDIEVQPAPGRDVLIREAGGSAVELATTLDLDILKSAIASAVIAIGGGGAATINAAADLLVAALVPTPSPPTWPVGTKALKAERR